MKNIQTLKEICKTFRGAVKPDYEICSYNNSIEDLKSNKSLIPYIDYEDLNSPDINLRLDLSNYKKCLIYEKSISKEEYKRQIKEHKQRNKTYSEKYKEALERGDKISAELMLNKIGEAIDNPPIKPKYAKFLEKESILISGYGNKFNFCIFTPSKIIPKIAISNNVFVAIPKKNVVSEFICYQFSQNQEVKKQITGFLSGRFIIRFKNNDIENIFFQLPSLEEQKKVVSGFKDAFIKKLIQKHDEAIGRLNKEKLSEDFQFGAAMAHNIFNKLLPITGVLESIEKFSSNKGLLNEMIDEPLDDEDKVDTLKICIERGINQCKSIESLINSTKKVLAESISKEEFELCNILEFCNKIKKDHKSSDFKFNVIGTNIKLNIHRGSFKEAIECMLSNAKMHAWRDEKEKIFEIEIAKNETDQTAHIICHNSGKPFPKDLPVETYRKLLGKSTKSKGTGYGGAWVDKFLNIHNGKLEIIPLGEHHGTKFIIILPLN